MEWFIKTNIFSQDIIIQIGAKYTDIYGLRTHPLYNSYGIWYDISNWKYCKTIKKTSAITLLLLVIHTYHCSEKSVGFGDIFLTCWVDCQCLQELVVNGELVMFMFNDINNNNIPHFYIQNQTIIWVSAFPSALWYCICCAFVLC